MSFFMFSYMGNRMKYSDLKSIVKNQLVHNLISYIFHTNQSKNTKYCPDVVRGML